MKVTVFGAGLAGLSAAEELVRHRYGDIASTVRRNGLVFDLG